MLLLFQSDVHSQKKFQHTEETCPTISYKFVLILSDKIKGKRVVITGASTGIGEHLAYQYSRLGARVLITARREHVLKQVGIWNGYK